jgi:hypothetical protein
VVIIHDFLRKLERHATQAVRYVVERILANGF